MVPFALFVILFLYRTVHIYMPLTIKTKKKKKDAVLTFSSLD